MSDSWIVRNDNLNFWKKFVLNQLDNGPITEIQIAANVDKKNHRDLAIAITDLWWDDLVEWDDSGRLEKKKLDGKIPPDPSCLEPTD